MEKKKIFANSQKELQIKHWKWSFSFFTSDKIFERIIFEELFNFFSANKLIYDSCIKQLSSMTHDFFAYFEIR